MSTDPNTLISVAAGGLAVALVIGIAAECSAQIRMDARSALREAFSVSCLAQVAVVLLILAAAAVYAIAMGA